MSDPMVELLIRLEEAQTQEAKQFVVVASDAYSGDIINATGPFDQAELALVQAGRDEADWRRHADDQVEADSITYTVVALWEPTS